MSSISVIIPTRGRPHFLKQAVQSVLAQSHPAKEIIVVDDGAGAREAVARLNADITVLDNQQRGSVPARNLGVAQARGSRICLLDDDDWFTDADYFAKAAEAFDRDASFCHADGRLVFDDGRPDLPFSVHADAEGLARDNMILISGVIYRRGLHAELGSFDESLPFYWDWDWSLRVARAGHPLTRIRRPAVSIRVHARDLSGDSLDAKRRANLDRFSTKHALPPIPLRNRFAVAAQA